MFGLRGITEVTPSFITLTLYHTVGIMSIPKMKIIAILSKSGVDMGDTGVI